METIQEAAEIMRDVENVVNEQTAALYAVKQWLDEKASEFAGAGVEGHAGTLKQVSDQVEAIAAVLQGGVSAVDAAIGNLMSLE